MSARPRPACDRMRDGRFSPAFIAPRCAVARESSPCRLRTRATVFVCGLRHLRARPSRGQTLPPVTMSSSPSGKKARIRRLVAPLPQLPAEPGAPAGSRGTRFRAGRDIRHADALRLPEPGRGGRSAGMAGRRRPGTARGSRADWREFRGRSMGPADQHREPRSGGTRQGHGRNGARAADCPPDSLRRARDAHRPAAVAAGRGDREQPGCGAAQPRRTAAAGGAARRHDCARSDPE